MVLLEREWGLDVAFNGIHRRQALGTSPDVPTGVGSFEFLATQPGRPNVPVAYDPCRPIELVVNSDMEPAGAQGIVTEAVKEVSRATGLQLQIVGRTDETPSEDRLARNSLRYQRGWAPVLVAWTDPSVIRRLAGDIAGLGGSTPQPSELGSTVRYVTGTVSLDGPQLGRLLQRPNGRAHVRAVVLHEIGHLVGLAHVDDPNELMAEENTGVFDFGPGDREGLAALGRGSCA